MRGSLARAETITRDHRMVVALDPQLPPVCVDSPSITEVIYILVDNASKYSAPGTTVTVRASQIDEQHVELRVTDEGPGIPADLRERVFEKFFRIPGRDPSDSRRGGVGLGLPIARRLVEAQAGRIWIEPPTSSARGTVAMTLPVARDAAGVSNGQSDRAAAGVMAMK